MTITLLFCFILNGRTQFSNQVAVTSKSGNQIGIQGALSLDFDGDGLKDVLGYSKYINTHNIGWYKNLGGNLFSDMKLLLSHSDKLNLTLIDIDSDGDKDYLILRPASCEISWIENTGNGIFGAENIISNNALCNSNHCTTLDVDNDGDEDFVLTKNVFLGTSNSSSIVLFKNLGNNQFDYTYSKTLSSIRYASNIEAIDVDGDGYKDLCTYSRDQSATSFSLSWYKNDSTGIFGAEQIISSSSFGNSGIYSFDIDLDGDLDLVTYTISSNINIQWYENNGTGTLPSPQSIFLSTAPSNTFSFKMTYGNLDNDLDNDIIIFKDDTLSWIENLGNTSFSSPKVISEGNNNSVSTANSIEVGDLNNDGNLDVLNTTSLQILWHKNLGLGSFEEDILISRNTIEPTSIEFEDIDTDGDIDILVTSLSDDKLSWFENDSYGNYIRQHEINANLNKPKFARVIDLNKDGKNDILTSSDSPSKLSYFEKNRPNSFSNPLSLCNIGGNHSYSVVADLNGDLISDIVVERESRVEWYRGIDSVNFNCFSWGQINTFTGASGNYFEKPVIFDSDNDGDNDVLLINTLSSVDKIMFHENLGAGAFSTGVELGFDFNMHDVLTYDFDGDGDLDIICAAWKLFYLENLGGNNFATKVEISNLEHIDIEISDLDLDGIKDITAISTTTNEVSIYKGLGGFNFGSNELISNQINEGILVKTGDIDGDGDIDIVSASKNDNKIAIYKNYALNQAEISGKTFYDINQNNIYDTTDYVLNFINVNSTPQSDFTYSSSNGSYFKKFSDSIGIYHIEPEHLTGWSITTDSLFYTINIDTNVQIIDSLDFGYYPDTIIDKINLDMIGAFPRCNTTVNNWVSLQNIGTTILSGTFKVELDQSITYVGSSIAPDSINGQTIYWSFDSLFFFEFESLNLTVNMPGFTNIGDTLESITTFFVKDSTGSLSYLSADTLKQILVCAYDPNDKIVDPLGFDSLGYLPLSNEFLEYTIRFQNTGNDTAINVVITDQLDLDLDWSSLKLIGSSHPVQIDGEQNGLVTFNFTNIMLPDSNVNELASHGYIKYRIKHKADQSNLFTTVNNTAKIFFDFNPPIVTNTTITTLYNCDHVYSNLFVTTQICEASTLIASNSNSFPNTWSVFDTTFANTDHINFYQDTLGTFDLKLTSYNNICPYDTTIQFIIDHFQEITTSDTFYICPNDSISIFNSYKLQPGVYIDTFQSITYCDSISTILLEHYPTFNSSTLDTISLCFGDSLIISGRYISTMGTYLDSLQSIYGCDSIRTRYVHYYPIYPANPPDTLTICVGDSLIVFDEYQTDPGLYKKELKNIYGCDSSIYKYLFLEDTYILEKFDTILSGDSLYFSGQHFYFSGIYYDSLSTNLNGCDSIIKLNLFVECIPQSSEVIRQICEGDSIFIAGKYQTQIGIYYDTLQNIFGCDSSIIIHLIKFENSKSTFNNIPDTLCLRNSNYHLIGSPDGGIFSGTAVIDNHFSPFAAGVGMHEINYKVIDTNNCFTNDTNFIYVIDCFDNEDNQFKHIKIFPNPFNDLTTIDLGQVDIQNYTVKIFNAAGELVFQIPVIESSYITLSESYLSKGTYIFILTDKLSQHVVFSTKLVSQ